MLNEKKNVQIDSQDECRLSHWYQEPTTKARFNHTRSYALVSEPHKLIHDYVAQNISKIGAGHTNESFIYFVDNFKKMEDASTKLFGLLDQMILESASECRNKRH